MGSHFAEDLDLVPSMAAHKSSRGYNTWPSQALDTHVVHKCVCVRAHIYVHKKFNGLCMYVYT